MLFRSTLFNIAFFAWTAAASISLLATFVLPRRVLVSGVRIWARGTAKMLEILIGVVTEIRGREHLPKGGAIIASKHQSAWETIMFSVILPDPALVMKKELTRIPLYGWCAAMAGHIVVDRAAGTAAMKHLLRTAKAVVGEGRDVVIFPEGTRTQPGERRPYQPGIAALYTYLDAPLVPVALNSGLYWGRRSFAKRPGRIIVEFLPPVPKGLPRKFFLKELQERIESATDALIAESSMEKYGDN